MTFQPDIIVTGPDGVTLVVEVKASLKNLEQTEKELQRYMTGMHCPTGVLITRERMRIYRDLYTSPPSIQRVGEFDIQDLWPEQLPPGEPSFEIFVQQWLERLGMQSIGGLPRSVASALREYILPAVAGGEVRAAHPRYS